MKDTVTPYNDNDVHGPSLGSVPVTVLILTQNEELNIERCLASVGWADQVIVIDSGSSDRTVEFARASGSEVVNQAWLGFGAQRAFALRLPQVANEWIYFIDADEWVSSGLAAEVESAIQTPDVSAFSQRFRLIFQGSWIRHCGWYTGSWITRLMRRADAEYVHASTGERPTIHGRTAKLSNDLIDEDLKGLATWLHKHVEYAVLDASLQLHANQRSRVRRLIAVRRHSPMPFGRALAKEVYVLLPFPGMSIFFYMYIVRAGFLDGKQGLRFCLYHAWFRMTARALREDRATGERK